MWAPFHDKVLEPAELINELQDQDTRFYQSKNFHRWREDFVKYKISGARMLFAPLYAVEKGFLRGIKTNRIGSKKISFLLRIRHEHGAEEALNWLSREFSNDRHFLAVRRNAVEFLEKFVPEIPTEDILFLQSDQYNYFDRLKDEYHRLIEETDQNPVKGFRLAHNRHHVREFDSMENYIPLVLTIDGIHNLDLENMTNHDQVRKRIQQIKGEAPLENDNKVWEHTPFSISLSGYMGNSLYGNSSVLPEFGSFLYGDNENQGKGFLKELSFDIVRELLSLDESCNPTSSRRILVDVKHLSPASRQDFYSKIIRKANLKLKEPIPVIASHAAYAGVDTLEDMMRHSEKSNRGESRSNGFLSTGGNLCDEDVVEIHKTWGLLGLTLDTRLLGEDKNSWLANVKFKPINKKRALSLLRRNIEQFVRIPFEYYLDEPLRIWDAISISQDISGRYGSRQFGDLSLMDIEKELAVMLADMKRDEPLWFGTWRPGELAYKICWDNAFQFVRKHYRKNYEELMN